MKKRKKSPTWPFKNRFLEWHEKLFAKGIKKGKFKLKELFEWLSFNTRNKQNKSVEQHNKYLLLVQTAGFPIMHWKPGPNPLQMSNSFYSGFLSEMSKAWACSYPNCVTDRELHQRFQHLRFKIITSIFIFEICKQLHKLSF